MTASSPGLGPVPCAWLCWADISGPFMNEEGGFYEWVKSECLANLLQKENPCPEIQSHMDVDVQAPFFIGKN